MQDLDVNLLFVCAGWQRPCDGPIHRPKILTKSLNSRFRNPVKEVLTALACDRIEIDDIFFGKTCKL